VSAAAGRRRESVAGILARVGQEPWKAGFFATLRAVEAADPHDVPLGRARRPEDEPLRLGQEPDLAFAPATISGVLPGSSARPPRLRSRFLGLFGPNGPLPLHLTEYARQRIRNHGDHTFAAFADLFHHRVLALFYRAWADARVAPGADRPERDPFARHLACLAGIGLPGLRGRDSVPDTVRMQFAGRIGSSSRQPDAIERALADQLGVPVRVREFVGHWQPLDVGDRCRLGRSGAETGALGRTAVLGEAVWLVEDRFRVTLGPMSLDAYRELRPDRESGRRMQDLIRSLAGREFDWEVEWIVRKEEVPPLKLDGSSGLGIDAWAVTRRHERDPHVRCVGSGDPAVRIGDRP
jgi:type VI secretion system protein ImpH